MTKPVSIDYRLGAHGWSSFTLKIGDASVDVGPFGYCTDALGDLVRAALVVAVSGDDAVVTFDGEPREWRLIVKRAHGEGRGRTDVHVTISDSHRPVRDDDHPPRIDSRVEHSPQAALGPGWKRVVVRVDPTSSPSPLERVTVFESFTEADEFARAVRTAAQAVFDEYGIDGYDQAWLPIRNGFPLRALHALTLALAIEEPAVQNS
jgi:hypothetical protein